MTCTICGRYADPDRETGYDADEVCSKACALKLEEREELEAEDEREQAQEVDPIESDLHDFGSVLASLVDLVKDCHDPAKLWDVYVELGKLAKATTELQDGVAKLHFKASWNAARDPNYSVKIVGLQ